ncbi:MAG: hypothetical protein ACTHN3_09135 [Solirubrobacterales bacterium]
MRRFALAAALVAAVLALPASAASAAPHSPTGEYAVFSDCPLSRPNIFLCLYSKTSGGTFTIGSKAVPVKNPVTLQGALEPTEAGLVFQGAEDGNTLSKTPQPVPGGLLGVTAPSWWPTLLKELFNETINNGFTGVTATVELAAPATAVKVNLENLLFGFAGPAITLPVKVKLSNPFLGSNCYIGSNSNPIVIPFTTGTTSPPPPNTPITGSPGTFSVNPAEDILTSSNNKLVENAFAAPGANGCGGILFSWAVDPFVNSIVGIPSPAGTNTAILEGTTQSGVAESVRNSEP